MASDEEVFATQQSQTPLFDKMAAAVGKGLDYLINDVLIGTVGGWMDKHVTAANIMDKGSNMMAGVSASVSNAMPEMPSLGRGKSSPERSATQAIEPSIQQEVSLSPAPVRETEDLGTPEQSTYASLVENVNLAHCNGLACADAHEADLNNLSTAGVAMNKEQTVNRGSSVMV